MINNIMIETSSMIDFIIEVLINNLKFYINDNRELDLNKKNTILIYNCSIQSSDY